MQNIVCKIQACNVTIPNPKTSIHKYDSLLETLSLKWQTAYLLLYNTRLNLAIKASQNITTAATSVQFPSQITRDKIKYWSKT